MNGIDCSAEGATEDICELEEAADSIEETVTIDNIEFLKEKDVLDAILAMGNHMLNDMSCFPHSLQLDVSKLLLKENVKLIVESAEIAVKKTSNQGSK